MKFWASLVAGIFTLTIGINLAIHGVTDKDTWSARIGGCFLGIFCMLAWLRPPPKRGW